MNNNLNVEPSASKKRIRTISSLSEEQIQQKRRVDCKAQRAFRQRTKDHISDLEKQITELQESSLQIESRLQQELRTLREENDTLVWRLENISDLVSASRSVNAHRNIASQHDNFARHDNVSHSERRHHAERSQLQSHQVALPLEPNYEITHVQTPEDVETVAADHLESIVSDYQAHQNSAESAASSYHLGPTVIHSGPSTSVSGSTIDGETHHHFTTQDHEHPYVTPDTSTVTEDVQVIQSGNYRFPAAILNPVDPTVVNLQLGKSSNSSPEEDSVPSTSVLSHTSVHAGHVITGIGALSTVLPTHIAPTCPLDGILLGFLNSSRNMISQGVSPDTIMGPERASAKALGRTELAEFVPPLSRVMSEVMSTFPLVGKPERLGLFYLMHQTTRWQIFPTKESYLYMPLWLRPTVMQITIPHAAWIDNVPWPGVRDLLIEHTDEYPYRLWTENFTQNVSLNWKFDYSDALSETENDVVMHSIFEKHVRRLKNWTVSAEFGRLFPKLLPAIHSPG